MPDPAIIIERMQLLNHILAYGGVISVVFTAFLLYDYFTKKRHGAHVSQYGLFLAFAVSLFVAVLTLVYSEFFGLMPCGLCWLERVAIYGLVLLTGTALYFGDRQCARYGIVFASFGAIISLYHHYVQMGGTEFVACPTSGASCTQRFFFEFDFVTFPLMGVFYFAFMIVLFHYIRTASVETQDRANSAQVED